MSGDKPRRQGKYSPSQEVERSFGGSITNLSFPLHTNLPMGMRKSQWKGTLPTMVPKGWAEQARSRDPKTWVHTIPSNSTVSPTISQGLSICLLMAVTVTSQEAQVRKSVPMCRCVYHTCPHLTGPESRGHEAAPGEQRGAAPGQSGQFQGWQTGPGTQVRGRQRNI